MITRFVPTQAELTQLRAEGMTRDDIAKAYGVSLSTVKRWLEHHHVGRRVTQRSIDDATRSERAKERMAQEAVHHEEGISLMDKCKQVLGRRMGENNRGYTLDGRHASSMQVIKAAETLQPDIQASRTSMSRRRGNLDTDG